MRIGKINEEAAAQIQVMTFHAYGMEILRSFWVEAELEVKSNLLDKIDALLHLEKNLRRFRTRTLSESARPDSESSGDFRRDLTR